MQAWPSSISADSATACTPDCESAPPAPAAAWRPRPVRSSPGPAPRDYDAPEGSSEVRDAVGPGLSLNLTPGQAAVREATRRAPRDDPGGSPAAASRAGVGRRRRPVVRRSLRPHGRCRGRLRRGDLDTRRDPSCVVPAPAIPDPAAIFARRHHDRPRLPRYQRPPLHRGPARPPSAKVAAVPT